MENEKIILSIIIPCYNCAKTIRECVVSVVNEAIANNLPYEVIVVDDGSTDNTLEILNELVAENENIKVVSQKNAGPSSARNNGMKLARGEFIALNDSDDKWISGKLKIQLEYFHQHSDVDLVCAKYGNGNLGKTQVITYRKEAFHNYFSPQTSVFRRSVCQKFQFPEKQKFSEDMHFMLDVMTVYKCVYKSVLSTEPVLKKRIFGESGLSFHLWKMEKGELQNILYAWKLKKISLLLLICAIMWSLIKHFRRCLISIFGKLLNGAKK